MTSDLCIAGKRDDALLDPCTARVVDPDHGAPVLEGQVHDLADLLGEDLAERATEDREVLREEEDLAAEDRAVAGDDSVPVRAAIHHPEVRLAMADVSVQLDERAWITQLLGAFPGEELTLFAAARHGLLAAGMQRRSSQLLEPLELSRSRFVPVCHRRGA
jgi:hypothetical protein